MRVRTCGVDIRLSIQDGAVIAQTIPSPEIRALPICEVLDIGALPAEVSAWLRILEKVPTDGRKPSA